MNLESYRILDSVQLNVPAYYPYQMVGVASYNDLNNFLLTEPTVYKLRTQTTSNIVLGTQATRTFSYVYRKMSKISITYYPSIL